MRTASPPLSVMSFQASSRATSHVPLRHHYGFLMRQLYQRPRHDCTNDHVIPTSYTNSQPKAHQQSVNSHVRLFEREKGESHKQRTRDTEPMITSND